MTTAKLDALAKEHEEALKLLEEMLFAFEWVKDHDDTKDKVRKFLSEIAVVVA